MKVASASTPLATCDVVPLISARRAPLHGLTRGLSRAAPHRDGPADMKSSHNGGREARSVTVLLRPARHRRSRRPLASDDRAHYTGARDRERRAHLEQDCWG